MCLKILEAKNMGILKQISQILIFYQPREHRAKKTFAKKLCIKSLKTLIFAGSVNDETKMNFHNQS